MRCMSEQAEAARGQQEAAQREQELLRRLHEAEVRLQAPNAAVQLPMRHPNPKALALLIFCTRLSGRPSGQF
jgi:hypothetical protein